MAQIANITGAAWPTSGAASAGTTGLNTCTGFTHATSADMPPGSVSAGIIQTVADAGGTVRIDAANVPLQTDADHYVRLWVKAKRTATTLLTDGTSANIHDVVSSAATKLRTQFYCRNNAYLTGINIVVSEFLTGGNFVCLSNLGGSGSQASIAFDQWTEIVWHIRKHASAGVYEVYINGVLIFSRYDLPTEGEILLADLGDDWRFIFPAWAGVQWQIAGPAESWNGDDISILPIQALNGGSDSDTQQTFPAVWVNRKGAPWTATTSGAGALTYRDWATGGVNAQRRGFILGGSAADVWTVTTAQDIGTLTYDASGWVSIAVSDFYLPSGASASIRFRNAGDTDDLLKIDIGGSQLSIGGTNKLTFDHADRWAVILHLSSSGGAKLSLSNLTDFVGAETLRSVDLGSWMPAAIGEIRWEVTLGSASCELGPMVVGTRLWMAGIDSLSHAASNGSSPALATANHVVTYLPTCWDTQLIPGGPYMQRVNGLRRMNVVLIVGRSGATRTEFTTSTLPGFEHARAMGLVCVDAGSINDISTINSSNPATVTGTLNTQIRSMCDMLLPAGNTAWLSTQIRREQGTYTEQELNGTNLLNNYVRIIAAEKQTSDNRVWLSDVAAYIGKHATQFTAGDDTHFNAAGDQLDAVYMATYRTTPTRCSEAAKYAEDQAEVAQHLDEIDGGVIVLEQVGTGMTAAAVQTAVATALDGRNLTADAGAKLALLDVDENGAITTNNPSVATDEVAIDFDGGSVQIS
jgi:hypothetical protein